ncbi:Crp/Fnr family transcriptional regulator [Granulicella arctica]|uniref:Crp/Fnr family transcriptional regulator n=1 Tax=Granulicella arctica TaxID=940613 RepID=UPI0021E096BC|nr:Crp/Fnr family transcriptional regulator [Granulicella arctica]
MFLVAKAHLWMPSTFTLGSPSNCASCEYRSLRMFCNLDDRALAEYSAMGTEARLPKGTILFDESAPSTNVFVLCTGQVKLFCTSKEGKTLILKIAMPGDVLGLGAVISGTPYEVTAETIQPTQVKSIRRDDFLAFLQRNSEAGLKAATSLSDDYKAAFFDARRLALSSSSAGRLAGVLLDWGRTAAACGKLEMRFTMALSHEDLASLVGSSRETVTRNLSQFKRDNLIQVRGSSILILAPKLLEQLAV